MKWIKKNKITLIAIIVFTIITLVGYQAVRVFFPTTDKAIYGDRLDGKVSVDEELYDGIKTRMSEKEFVKDVSVTEKGRIINIIVTVLDSTSMDAAQSLKNLVLEGFSDSQLSYYDFQLMIKKEDEKENNFPIIAYKQHNSTEFYWNRERAKTATEEEEGK